VKFIGENEFFFAAGISNCGHFELEKQREFRGGLVREIDAERGLNFFGLAGWLQMV